jgi:hypothetical protein
MDSVTLTLGNAELEASIRMGYDRTEWSCLAVIGAAVIVPPILLLFRWPIAVTFGIFLLSACLIRLALSRRA